MNFSCTVWKSVDGQSRSIGATLLFSNSTLSVTGGVFLPCQSWLGEVVCWTEHLLTYQRMTTVPLCYDGKRCLETFFFTEVKISNRWRLIGFFWVWCSFLLSYVILFVWEDFFRCHWHHVLVVLWFRCKQRRISALTVACWDQDKPVAEKGSRQKCVIWLWEHYSSSVEGMLQARVHIEKAKGQYSI